MEVNLLELLSRKKVSEDSGAGSVAGFSAPMGDDNHIVKKKTVTEDDEQQDTKSFKGEKFEITTSWRGTNKGTTIMVHQIDGDGTLFNSDEKVKQILNYLESTF